MPPARTGASWRPRERLKGSRPAEGFVSGASGEEIVGRVARELDREAMARAGDEVRAERASFEEGLNAH